MDETKDKPRAPGQAAAADDGRMRIAKAIARAGLCSRRDAEAWIAEGRVTLNGKLLDTPAIVVGPGDRIAVDGVALPEAETVRLWRYHKPAGLVTSHKDPQGRPTVFTALPEGMPRVISVGRLDLATEGLLLLTNSGELARHLELPSTGWLRRYRVRAHGRIKDADLDPIRQGITLDGVQYGPVEARLDREQGSNMWLTLSLREGKNREVKKLLGALGLEVNRLIRISYGPFQLGDLAVRSVEEVKGKTLRDQLGPNISAQLGLESPHKAKMRAARTTQGTLIPRENVPRREKARPPRTKPMRAKAGPSDRRPGRKNADASGKRPERGAAAHNPERPTTAKPHLRAKTRPGGIRGGPRKPAR